MQRQSSRKPRPISCRAGITDLCAALLQQAKRDALDPLLAPDVLVFADSYLLRLYCEVGGFVNWRLVRDALLSLAAEGSEAGDRA